MINIGLIGLGGIGKTHFYNSRRLENCRLVAVADVSKKAQGLAKAHGIKSVYDDYQKLLKSPDIDCVIISLPNYLHAECAITAAEHGKHFFIEKPLARNVREGEEIVFKARKAGVKAMVGFPLRFSEFAEMKKDISKGYLGDVVTAIATNVSSGPFFQRVSRAFVPLPVPSWWFQPELVGGGVLMDLGSHMVDLLLFYFGDTVDSVQGMLGHRFNMPFEDHAFCLVKFKKGISAIVNVSWLSPERILRVELFGTAGNSLGRSETPTVFDYVKSAIKRESMENSPAFRKELQHFIDCLITDKFPSPSVEEGLQSLKVISEAYKNSLRLESENEQGK